METKPKLKLKKNIHKSFRLFDFHIYDEKEENEQQMKFYIQMYGINEKGETCSIIIDDYKPFFYIKVSDNWFERDNIAFKTELKKRTGWDTIAGMEIVKNKKLYGFSGGREFKFVKLIFHTTIAMNKVKNIWNDNGKRKNFIYKNKELELYESNIPPLLRYFHIQQVSPSGWIQIKMNSVSNLNNSTCVFSYKCSQKAIQPLPDKETMVPYKICSFDIEASSSHGDFPVPIKSYKRLAINIIDLINQQKLDNNKKIQMLLDYSIWTAFGYKKIENIDLVYPIDVPKKIDITNMIKQFLKKTIKDVNEESEVNEILTLNDIFDKMKEDEDEDENFENNIKKGKQKNVKDETTIVDILISDIARDQKIKYLDMTLTSVFPKLEGDKVTFVGSTFMNYGEKEPYYNHCLVVGSCDKLNNIDVDVCDNEYDLLIKWKELIASEDPDIIIGYNIFGFDYEFMFRRAKENHCESEFLQLSRNKGEMCGKIKDGEIEIENTKVVLASGEYDLRYYKMNGRLQIDMYSYFRRDFNLASYKLDDVAGEFISDDIVETKSIEIDGKPYTELYSKNITGLNENDYIHIELCGFTTDYYKDGKKFQVLKIERDSNINKLLIEDHHIFEKKTIKWTMAKDDVTPQDIFRLTNGDSSDRARVAKYCIQDCNLVHHLMNKIDVITGYVEMASICSVPISFLVFRGQGIKLTSYVAKKCREKNTLMPDLEKSFDDSGYEGAIVLPPKCSMYMEDPVACVDYSSLYPSSMISQNYSHDSKVWTKEYDLDGNLIKETGDVDGSGNYIYDNLPGYEYINIEFDTFKYKRKTPTSRAEKVKSGIKVCRWAQLPNNEKSIMPAILEELLRARKATKKLMKNEKDPFMENILDKRQLGYKVTANSLYGQCGAKTSTFYEKDVAASTTATGRMMITYARRMIEEVYGNLTYETKENGKVITNAEYVYGDTDSVFFTFNLKDAETNELIKGQKALEITIEIAQDVADLCTSFLKPPMGLEYEKTLMPFILLSKKRYVGMLYEFNPNKGKMKFMGLSLKRRDSCDYLKDTYGGILNILMYDNDVEKAIEFLNQSLNELISGNVHMDKLAITRALRSDYKNPNQIAHKVLSNRIGERDPGNKPKPGDRIKYVFINNDKPKALLGDRVETPEFIIENKLQIDYTYYITNQLMKPLQQLFGLALEQIWFNRGKKQAIKEYKKELDKMEKESKDDYELYMKKREKYCSAKIKTILFDKILNKINLDKNKLQKISNFFV